MAFVSVKLRSGLLHGVTVEGEVEPVKTDILRVLGTASFLGLSGGGESFILNAADIESIKVTPSE